MENRFIRAFNLGCAAILGTAALMVVLSWLGEGGSTPQIDPGYLPMAFNTALCFLLCAASIGLSEAMWCKSASAAAIVVALLGALTFIDHIAGLNSGIDGPFAQSFTMAGAPNAGRMPTGASLAFAVLGTTLAFVIPCQRLPMLAVLGTALTGSLVACGALAMLIAGAIELNTLDIVTIRMAWHTSVCFVLLGTVIVLFAKQRAAGRPLWLPIPVFLGLVAATALITQAIRTQQHADLQQAVKSETRHAAQATERQLHQLYQGLDRMGQRWDGQHGTPRPVWESDAAAYLQDFPFLSSLFWADDSGQLQWIVPRDKKSTWDRYDLRADPDIASTLNWAIGLRASRATPIMAVAQAGPGNLFFYVRALQNEGRNEGFLVAVIDVGELFAAVLANALSGDLSITVSEDDRVIFAGSVGGQAAALGLAERIPIVNLGRSWLVTGRLGVSSKSAYSSAAAAVAVAGLLIASLVAFSVSLAVKREDDLRRLRASEERLALAVSGTADGLWDWETEPDRVSYSPRFLEILGYRDAGDFPSTARGFLKLVDPADRRAVIAAARSYWADHSVFNLTFRARHHDGHQVWLKMRGQGVWAEDGTAQRMIGFISDVSERKQAEQKLLAYASELERSNRELDDFAYVASHDLKAPLRVINNASRWLEEDLAEHMAAEDRMNMEMLRGRVRRMEKLLDDLLEYSRVGRSSDARFNETIDGQTLMENILVLLSPPAGFVVNVAPAFADIRIKRMPVQQTLFNLIANAIKHHNRDNGLIEVEVADEGNHYRFTVRDDGPGIAPRFHEQVFKMFKTLKPRDQVEGSGMGLAFVKKTVDYFGGDLRLVSEEGAGAAFSFTWPKEVQPRGKAEPKAA